MVDFRNPVIIDNGSGMIKAGLADNDRPSAMFPSVIGYPRLASAMEGADHKEYFIGNEAQSRRGVLSLAYPIEHGEVTDWKGMEKIWTHCYANELRINPSEHPALLTEAPLNPRANKIQMVDIFFQAFEVPAFYVSIQAVLSLYSNGSVTGIVFDSGDGVTHIVPVFEGYALTHAIARINIAGRDITEYLVRLLVERGIYMNSSSEREVVKDIKEKLCYVALDYSEEIEMSNRNSDVEKHYILPDGQDIVLGSERFRAPEVLFTPELMGYDIDGVAVRTDKSIKACDLDLRKALYDNVILSGGTTMYPGLPERLQKDLKSRAPATVKVSVRATDDRKYSVWEGGKIFCTKSMTQESWITKAEYEEYGPEIVFRKCF